jgi:hypothetical protein
MWRRAPTTSPNGTIVPRTTIQSIRSQTGRWLEARFPSRETSSSTRPAGKFHHGATKAANLGQLCGSDAGAEDDLRDGSVDGEQRCGNRDHEVPERRARLDHRANVHR